MMLYNDDLVDYDKQVDFGVDIQNMKKADLSKLKTVFPVDSNDHLLD